MIDHRAELNRINVFPVPDGDTGTNLAVTFRGMMAAARRDGERALGAVAARLAEASVVSARGNSGMLFSRFLFGFAEAVRSLERARAPEFAAALGHAAERLYRAVEEPVEGTLLTVVREAAAQAERLASRTPDLLDLLHGALDRARRALEETRDALPALREAGVVDAGGKGFVRFLEGVLALLTGEARPPPEPVEEVPEAAARAEYRGEGGQFCTEFLVRGSALPAEPEFARSVRALGASLVIHRTPEIAKVHIHTDRPAGVRAALRAFGLVEAVKVEDIRAQHRSLERRGVAVVTDSTCDLPPEWILGHNVTVVPMTVLFGEEAYLDQVEIGYEEFLQRLTDPAGPHPTTSQPSPAQFREAFERALESADRALVLLVSGALSGTLQSAQAVAREFDGRVTCFDSRSASLGLGFLVVRAAERLEAGASLEEVVPELCRARETSGLLFTVDTLDCLLRSGRVGAAKAFLGGLLDLKPVLSLDSGGRVVPAGRVRGRRALLERVQARLRKEVPRESPKVRFGIVHAAYPEIERLLVPRLREEFPQAELWVRPVTGVLAAHAGPGAWGVFYPVARGGGGAEQNAPPGL